MQNKIAYTNKISGSIFQPGHSWFRKQGGTWFSIRLMGHKLVSFGKLLRLWNQRRRQRQELYSLSDTILKDVGITRLDALEEADKPFWRP